MASADLSREVYVLALIDEFKNHRCLWDPKYSDRNSKLQRNIALYAISARFRTPVKTLKKKINNLLQSYRLYRQKIASSNGAYRPTWYAYNAIHRFMGDVNSPSVIAQTAAPDDVIVVSVKIIF